MTEFLFVKVLWFSIQTLQTDQTQTNKPEHRHLVLIRSEESNLQEAFPSPGTKLIA